MTKILVTGGAIARKPNGQFVKTRTRSWTPETWDDGWVDRRGKFHVYRPDFPNASPTGWAFRAHVIWWLATGQIIRHPQALHHRNQQPLDDHLENLQLMETGEHTRFHCQKPLVEKVCEVCGRAFQLPQWRINGGRGRWCSLACYWKSSELRSRTRQMQKENFLGKPGYWKGKTFNQEHRAAISVGVKRSWEGRG